MNSPLFLQQLDWWVFVDHEMEVHESNTDADNCGRNACNVRGHTTKAN